MARREAIGDNFSSLLEASWHQEECDVRLLLDTIQVINNSENTRSHDSSPQFPRCVERVICRIKNMRQVHNRVEPLPPDWHFARAVSGNWFRSKYLFVDSLRGENPVVVL